MANRLPWILGSLGGLHATLEQNLQELLGCHEEQGFIRTSTLRMLVAACETKEIEKKKTLTEGDVLEVIQSEAKRRRESMDEYGKAQRPDLAS